MPFRYLALNTVSALLQPHIITSISWNI